MFEVDEYIHLAAHAARLQDHHACMTYLKHALRQQPRNATAISMLATQHAALGLSRRAIEGLSTALAIEPRMSLVRIQLGLLLLDIGQSKEAKGQFALLAQGAEGALRAYSEGLTALADGQLLVAREKITAGLSHKSGDRQLHTIMTQVSEQLSRQASTRTAPQGGAGTGQSTDREISMGAYKQVSQ
jgi:tetratricopeptide (TPR) repeat protein